MSAKRREIKSPAKFNSHIHYIPHTRENKRAKYTLQCEFAKIKLFYSINHY